jgi:hypothetical protein
MIAGIKLEFSPLFPDYFAASLPAYQFDFVGEADHVIEVLLMEKPPVPLGTPSHILPNRRIYSYENREIVVTIDDATQQTRHTIETDSLWKRTSIFLNASIETNFAELEYVWTGIVFFEIALLHGMTALHASALLIHKTAILFSAPSGTGKSTQAGLWRKAFPDAITINDDKPLLRPTSEGIFVVGTPWSGKDIVNTNLEVPLGAIVFLEQSKQNKIVELTTMEQVKHMFRNTYRPRQADLAERNLALIDQIVGHARIVLYRCNMDPSAVTTLYRFLF